MRRLELLTHRIGGEFLDSLNSTASLTRLPDQVQGDTLDLAFIHVDRDPAIPAATLYRVTPWPAGIALRVSVLLIDAAPESGTFTLRVHDDEVTFEETAEITWPAAFADQAAIDAFKADVLAKLTALSNVGAGEIVASNPAQTPAHFLYFTWTDAANTRLIKAGANGLAPESFIKPAVQKNAPKMQQLVKLVQAPFVTSTDFEATAPVQPLVFEKQLGAVGSNEIQTIAFNTKTVGGLQLEWSGAKTALLALPGASPEQVAAALNAIVPEGDTNPSFRVTAMPNNSLAVEFIGPLAGAPQPELGAEIIASPNAAELSGTIALTNPRFERLLNGSEYAECWLEVVFTGAGEGTILRRFRLLNDGTDGGVIEDLNEIGAVQFIDREIYIDSGMGEPMILAAPGATYRPGTTGSTLVINHGLDTWRPICRVTLLEVDPGLFTAALAAYPEDVDAALAEPGVITGSHEVARGEFGEGATSENVVRITLPWPLVDDPSAPHDFRLLAVDVASPVGTLQAWSFKVLWENVVESLPAGQTLTDKLAEIEAMIGVLDGSLKIPPTGLDLPALIRAILAKIKADAEFRALFIDLVKTIVSSEDIMKVIATELRNRSEFVESIKKAFEDSTLLTTLIDALKTSAEFLTVMRSIVFEALQKGATLPDGLIVFAIADFHLAFPPWQEIDGPSFTQITGEVTTKKTTTGGGATVETVESTPKIEHISEKLRRFEPLPVALLGVALGAEITGTIGSATMADGTVRTVGSAGARVRTMGRRRGADYPAGTILARKNGIVYPVRRHAVGVDTWWPTEYERTIEALTIYDDQLETPSKLVSEFVFQGQLLGDVAGKVDVAFEAATITTGAQGSQETAPLAEVYAEKIGLSAARGFHQFALTINRTAEATTGIIKYRGEEREFVVPALPFKLRISTRRFDAENITGAEGCLLADVVSPTASIVTLE